MRPVDEVFLVRYDQHNHLCRSRQFFDDSVLAANTYESAHKVLVTESYQENRGVFRNLYILTEIIIGLLSRIVESKSHVVGSSLHEGLSLLRRGVDMPIRMFKYFVILDAVDTSDMYPI